MIGIGKSIRHKWVKVSKSDQSIDLVQVRFDHPLSSLPKLFELEPVL